MSSYIEIAFFNAVMIVPLAVLAIGVGWVFRRPALTHLLWVLILVKLMVPPVWQIPLVDSRWLAAPARQILHPVFFEPDRIVERQTLEQFNRLRQAARVPNRAEETNATANTMANTRPRPRSLAEQDKLIAIRRNSPLVIALKWMHSDSTRQYLIAGLTCLWGLGAVVWFSVQGLRCIRFRWSLAQGAAASMELQQFSNDCAQRLGLKKSPTVWLMPGVMSPMLWGNGHSTLLIFPEQLLDRLDQEAVGTLLTHELAHYRRHDHWVRVVALLATGFYWWHPVVWWARREIEAVEEECCDALVVKCTTARPKCYAEAILDTIDFLTEYRFRLPPLATGLSQFPILRQRLTWIMRGPRTQNIGMCGRLVCVLLACTLPVQPTWLTVVTAASVAPAPVVKPLQLELTRPVKPISSEAAEDVLNDFAANPTDTELESEVSPSKWLGFEVRSYSFDKRFVFLSNATAQLLLDLQTGRDFDLTPFDITAIAFSPDTNQFATIDGDRFLRLWDAEICDFQTWQIPGGPSKSVDLSYGARWIATGGRDGVVRIWNVASQKPIRELPRETAPVNCVRFSPAGELLAVATGESSLSNSGRIALFDVGSWSERISMNWNSPAAAVAFHTDGESLISGDWQGRIARWKLASGEVLGLVDGRKDLIAAAEFSANGSPLVDIEIPELDPNATWGEPSDQQYRWFFNNWPLTAPSAAVNSTRSGPSKTLP